MLNTPTLTTTSKKDLKIEIEVINKSTLKSLKDNEDIALRHPRIHNPMIQKGNEIKVNEAIKINISNWKNKYSTPAISLLRSSKSIKKSKKRFELMKSKDNLYWYIVRVK